MFFELTIIFKMENIKRNEEMSRNEIEKIEEILI